MTKISLLPFLLVLLSVSQGETEFQNIQQSGTSDCFLVQEPGKPADAEAVLSESLSRGCRSICLSAGEWNASRAVVIADQSAPLLIRSESAVTPAVFKGILSIRNSANVTLEDFILEGTLELDQTQSITIRRMTFRKGGIHLKGARCNQPNECKSFNNSIRVTDSVFRDYNRAIFAQRLENSTISGNLFDAGRIAGSCGNENAAIDLDGSGEDLDRPLEQGHSKANLIEGNEFHHQFNVGIRVKDSIGNVIRDNRFWNSYRALEFLAGARHNQTLNNYIGYLTQQPATSACPGPCGIYAGPGTFNNVFLNNFFEQNFELQFFDSNRNKTFIIDESGNANMFRSDFQAIRQ